MEKKGSYNGIKCRIGIAIEKPKKESLGEWSGWAIFDSKENYWTAKKHDLHEAVPVIRRESKHIFMAGKAFIKSWSESDLRIEFTGTKEIFEK